MTQFISRVFIVAIAALSLASCAMTTEMQPASLGLTASKKLVPSRTATPLGDSYSWEFTVSGSMADMRRDMTDSLMIIVGQVKEIRKNS